MQIEKGVNYINRESKSLFERSSRFLHPVKRRIRPIIFATGLAVLVILANPIDQQNSQVEAGPGPTPTPGRVIIVSPPVPTPKPDVIIIQPPVQQAPGKDVIIVQPPPAQVVHPEVVVCEPKVIQVPQFITPPSDPNTVPLRLDQLNAERAQARQEGAEEAQKKADEALKTCQTTQEAARKAQLEAEARATAVINASQGKVDWWWIPVTAIAALGAGSFVFTRPTVIHQIHPHGTPGHTHPHV